MTHTTEQERADFEREWMESTGTYSPPKRSSNGDYVYPGAYNAWKWWQAARRAPAVPETIEQRAKKLKGLQVLTGATAGVPEAIALARSRFVEAYGRSPLHDDLAYACLLIDAYGGAPAVPVISEAQVLAITTAYEQGVGKGHQSHTRKEAITNPYSDEWGCDSAWQMGYDEGREQAERKAAAPQPPEVEENPLQEQLDEALQSLEFYKRRCDLLQSIQPRMRDPERTMVCDVLANGHLLQSGDGQPDKARYAPPGAAPVQLPENIREGEPYDNPAFEALARALGVWGTAQSAVCAQFWIAAKEQST